MKKVAVYGSLREGMGNYFGFLTNSNKLSTEVVDIPYKMVDLGGFPGLVRDENIDKTKIEIFEVDDATYKRIERLEGYPSFYNKDVINTSVGDAEVYVLNRDEYSKCPPVSKVEDAYDWVTHYVNKNKRYYEI